MSQTQTAEVRVIPAIIGHHARLAAGLIQRVETLIHLVEGDHLLKAETVRQDLVQYLQHEILPHARGEEHALYPPVAALPDGRLLIAGLVDEHHTLAALVAELGATRTPVRVAAAARAIAALFDTHLHKENELVLPLLVAAPGINLAAVLASLHEVARETVEPGGCACGGGGCACGTGASESKQSCGCGREA